MCSCAEDIVNFQESEKIAKLLASVQADPAGRVFLLTRLNRSPRLQHFLQWSGERSLGEVLDATS